MQRTIFKDCKRIHFIVKILMNIYQNIHLSKSLTFDAFELDANIANFVYFGKTQLQCFDLVDLLGNPREI